MNFLISSPLYVSSLGNFDVFGGKSVFRNDYYL